LQAQLIMMLLNLLAKDYTPRSASIERFQVTTQRSDIVLC